MFCKYCGKPIDEGTMRCRICGRPVGPLEGGNGFWDLTDEKKEAVPESESAPARTDPAVTEELKSLREEVEKLRREKKMHPAGKRALPAVMAALFALLAMAGDLGGAFGPSLVGTVTQQAGDNLQTGILAGSIFPLVLIIALVLLGRKTKKS